METSWLYTTPSNRAAGGAKTAVSRPKCAVRKAASLSADSWDKVCTYISTSTALAAQRQIPSLTQVLDHFLGNPIFPTISY
jgi:hypothetical protein